MNGDPKNPDDGGVNRTDPIPDRGGATQADLKARKGALTLENMDDALFAAVLSGDEGTVRARLLGAGGNADGLASILDKTREQEENQVYLRQSQEQLTNDAARRSGEDKEYQLLATSYANWMRQMNAEGDEGPQGYVNPVTGEGSNFSAYDRAQTAKMQQAGLLKGNIIYTEDGKRYDTESQATQTGDGSIHFDDNSEIKWPDNVFTLPNGDHAQAISDKTRELADQLHMSQNDLTLFMSEKYHETGEQLPPGATAQQRSRVANAAAETALAAAAQINLDPGVVAGGTRTGVEAVQERKARDAAEFDITSSDSFDRTAIANADVSQALASHFAAPGDGPVAGGANAEVTGNDGSFKTKTGATYDARTNKIAMDGGTVSVPDGVKPAQVLDIVNRMIAQQGTLNAMELGAELDAARSAANASSPDASHFIAPPEQQDTEAVTVKASHIAKVGPPAPASAAGYDHAVDALKIAQGSNVEITAKDGSFKTKSGETYDASKHEMTMADGTKVDVPKGLTADQVRDVVDKILKDKNGVDAEVLTADLNAAANAPPQVTVSVFGTTPPNPTDNAAAKSHFAAPLTPAKSKFGATPDDGQAAIADDVAAAAAAIRGATEPPRAAVKAPAT